MASKLPKLSTVRNKCDALLTPIAKKLSPDCFLCGSETQVGHHHVHKSKSTRLRYEMSNIIPLCSHCHVVLHNNESYWASKIVDRKGIEWFKNLEKMGQEIVKTDVHYYIAQLDRLKKIYEAEQ